MNLQVNDTELSVPSLSCLHLSSILSTETPAILANLVDIISEEDGKKIIKGANDTFILERSVTVSADGIKGANTSISPTLLANRGTSDLPSIDSDLDYDDAIKRILVHEDEYPTPKETPYFNHHAFFANWAAYIRQTSGTEGHFGKHLLYGEVVTSTSTMLEKNPSLLQRLPSGVTAVATTQVAGRGRGSNVWVSPPGSLMFSTVVHHAMQISQKAPVVFIQYLAALAIVRGIQTYGPGYSALPVKLKWPNDIYAEDPSQPGLKSYVKIGGILVNSSYASGDYNLVIGIGINLSNAAPSTLR